MNKTKKIITIFLMVILLVLVSFYFKSVITANAIKEQQDYGDWLVDNCNCTERERLKCPDGFEISEDVRMCKKETFVCPEKGELVLYDKDCKEEVAWTNVLLGCSKYNCSGEIYEFNFDTEKWLKIN